MTQAQLDPWIAELPGQRRGLRAFVLWAAVHGYLARDLEVSPGTSRERRIAMDDEQRLGLARTLMRDRLDDPPARLAAALVLLFGQRFTRLAVLEADAAAVTDGRTFTGSSRRTASGVQRASMTRNHRVRCDRYPSIPWNRGGLRHAA
nr:hypothetical protein GCM10020063_042190 [Dactylosporangium thailandense]